MYKYVHHKKTPLCGELGKDKGFISFTQESFDLEGNRALTLTQTY